MSWIRGFTSACILLALLPCSISMRMSKDDAARLQEGSAVPLRNLTRLFQGSGDPKYATLNGDKQYLCCCHAGLMPVEGQEHNKMQVSCQLKDTSTDKARWWRSGCGGHMGSGWHSWNNFQKQEPQAATLPGAGSCVVPEDKVPDELSSVLDDFESGNRHEEEIVEEKSASLWRSLFGETAARIILADKIYTMDDEAPDATAIAIGRDGKIMARGSWQDMSKYKGWFTKVEEVRSPWVVVPGFVDPHIHTSMTPIELFLDVGIDVCPTLDCAFDLIRREADHYFKSNKLVKGWVLVRRLDRQFQSNDASKIKSADINMAFLNNITRHPLFIIESNFHFAYGNEAAFNKVFPEVHKGGHLWKPNSDGKLPNPDQGGEHGTFVRDKNGFLTGMLIESPALQPFISRALGDMKTSGYFEILNVIKRILQGAALRGVTSLHDMGLGIGMNPYMDATLLNAALTFTRKNPYIRVSASLVAKKGNLTSTNPFPAPSRLVGMLGQLVIGKPWHSIYNLTGLKAWADGSNQGGSGAQFEPYVGTNSSGKLSYGFSELKETINACNRRGWPLGVHANGDKAIHTVLDAYEAAAKETCGVDQCKHLRNRIEHCSLANDTQLERMSRLGISPSFLIGHLRVWGRVLQNMLGKERADNLDRCATALKHHLRMSLHSDYDVTAIDPLEMMETAVARTMKYGGDEVLNPAEKITPVQAIRAMTLDAAWQCHLETVTGSIQVGKYADLAVLKSDPARTEPTSIKDIIVQGTYFQGRRVVWNSKFVG